MPKIYEQKRHSLTESEWYQLGALLLKLGYTVRKDSELPPNKEKGVRIHYIEFEEK